jgi:outer membrane lipoprotein-sorting protein
MMKKILLFSLLLGYAWAGYADELSDKLAAQMAMVKTARSHFTEEKHLSLFTEPVVSEGIFIFDKAQQKLRWEYQKPFAKGFVIEGKKVFRVQDGRKTALKSAMGKTAAAQMMVWLTLDIDALSKTYRIAQQADKLIFTPITPNEVIDHIAVWVERAEGQNLPRVSAVKMTEKNGDFTLFNFTQSVLNGVVPAEAFQ